MTGVASRSGRADYDELVKFRQPKPGEPFFLLWGHDQVGAALVRHYAQLIHAAGADPAMVESALQLADDFDAWPHKKLVDADHLTEGARKQLAYQLSRRALAAGGDSDDPRLMLAEERALTAAFARLRPMLQALIEGGAWVDGKWVFDPASLQRGPHVAPTPSPIEGLQLFLSTLGRGQAATTPETV